MIDDFERCYRFMRSRDPRYDGFFFVGVTSTGIYCRPSCPARLPDRRNVRLFATAAAAQAAGFRACKRCEPDAAPGSPAWNRRADVAGRAFRLIADGIVDREGVQGLASRLGFNERQLNRILVAEVGAGPAQLARAHRAQAARTLIESTGLSFAEVALASGFGSVRQFNDTIQVIYARKPSELRRRARRKRAATTQGAVDLRLPARAPLDGTALLEFLGARAIPGVEHVEGGTYRRSLALEHGGGLVALTPEAGAARCVLQLDDLRDLTAAVARCRRLLDLDADPVSIDAQLGADPLLGELARRRPGMRVPGCVDGFELGVRAIVGQQVSVAAARTVLGRLVARYGEALAEPAGALTHRFPTAETLAESDPADLPFPRRRGEALRSLALLVAADGLRFDAGADSSAALAALLDIPGVGPWTASYVAMRALGDPDSFPAGDVGIRHALRRLGHAASGPQATSVAEPWRPWRSYAVMHLWSSLGAAPAPLSVVGPPGRALGAHDVDDLPQSDVRVHEVQAPLLGGRRTEDGRVADRADR
ncbi:MAG: DNA-3-methyladenine glycosylase 2 family protein [Thermoleophilaceae bacterium]|nr:DNA-3-methyladenine glycosylase 2 family protein [Thermoleophilaceae bacterium]